MKKNIITTIVTLTMVATVFTGCGSNDTKTDTKSDSVVASESTEIVSEGTEVVESTETEVVAAGDEVVFDDRGFGRHPKYKNIEFDESLYAKFYVGDSIHNSVYVTSDVNYDYLLQIVNDRFKDNVNISDLNEYVEYLTDLDTKAFESGVSSVMPNYELVTIGDYKLVKVTTDREGYIFTEYRLPIDFNGKYVHDGMVSYVTFTVNDYANKNTDTDPKVDELGCVTEEGVLEAIDVVNKEY